MLTSQGVVYIAVYQIDYLRMALASALAIAKLGEQSPIIIYSDLVCKEIVVSKTLKIEPIAVRFDLGCFKSRYLKTQLNKISPFAKTLFLDADVFPLRPIKLLWDQLEGNLAMGLAYKQTIGDCNHVNFAEQHYTLDRLPADTAQFNSGVILFNQDQETNNLFNCWHQEWCRFKKQDQLALARAIFITGSKPKLMDLKFNCSSCYTDNDTVLVHFSGKVAKQYFWEALSLEERQTTDRLLTF